MSVYQTFLFDCDCKNRGIILKGNEPYCRWCRTPLGHGGKINYDSDHFHQESSDVLPSEGELVCPSCGSATVVADTCTTVISEPFGGELKLGLAGFKCLACDTSGDFAGKNDTIIKSAIARLNRNSVKNILDYFDRIRVSRAGIDRVLSLPQGTLTKWRDGIVTPSPAELALLRCLRALPWLLLVAEFEFDLDKVGSQFIAMCKQSEDLINKAEST